MSHMTFAMKTPKSQFPNKFEINAVGGIESCPFCKCESVFIEPVDDLYQIECCNCRSSGPIRDSRLNALRVWNFRY